MKQSIREILLYAVSADFFISNMRLRVQKGKSIVGAFVTYDFPASAEELRRHSTASSESGILEPIALNKTLADPDDTWGSIYHFTGFWLDPSPPHYNPSNELKDFLSQGAPPALLTLGSMAEVADPGLAHKFADSIARTGHRGIILAALGRSKQVMPSDRIYFAEDIP